MLSPYPVGRGIRVVNFVGWHCRYHLATRLAGGSFANLVRDRRTVPWILAVVPKFLGEKTGLSFATSLRIFLSLSTLHIFTVSNLRCIMNFRVILCHLGIRALLIVGQ